MRIFQSCVLKLHRSHNEGAALTPPQPINETRYIKVSITEWRLTKIPTIGQQPKCALQGRAINKKEFIQTLYAHNANALTTYPCEPTPHLHSDGCTSRNHDSKTTTDKQTTPATLLGCRCQGDNITDTKPSITERNFPGGLAKILYGRLI